MTLFVSDAKTVDASSKSGNVILTMIVMTGVTKKAALTTPPNLRPP